MMPSSARPTRIGIASSRRWNSRRAHCVECSATIAVTDMKLIWKLGPASASGRKSSTTSAPAAISRMLMASRPSAMPNRISKAATQLRTVGT